MTITIAIIGAGYSGTSLAINLYRQATQPIKILLFEAKTKFAQGAAYSTLNLSHLLNVVAEDMSAFPDQPNDFVDWLKQNNILQDNEDQPISKQFAPRLVYGRYLQARLAASSQRSATGAVIELHYAEVVNLAQVDKQIKLLASNSQNFLADKVVLAHGNLEPKNIFPNLNTARYIYNPWNYDFVKAIPKDAAVLIMGTGLTMIDVVLALEDQKHTGKIYALSRRGLVPQPHDQFEAYKVTEKLPNTLRALVRHLRHEIKLLIAQGGDWRAVISSLRFITQPIWQSFSLKEKRRALRHLVPYWDTHRHRIAPQVAARLHSLKSTKQLQILAGRVLSAQENNGSSEIDVALQLRNSNTKQNLPVSYIVNCTGPNSNYRFAKNPLLANLIQQKILCPDELNLGLSVSDNGAVVNEQGVASDKIFTVGTPCKSLLWECVAVPDIRNQSAVLATTLLK